MVRHEAAEALGAIASPECITILEQHVDDACREVAETCQLAVGRTRYWRERRAQQRDEARVEGTAATKGSRKETFALSPAGSSQTGVCAEDGTDSAFMSGATTAVSRAAKPRLLRMLRCPSRH